MSGYTPITKQVREDYATRMAPHLDETRHKEFDRWLEQVKAKAWEEGHEAAAMRVPEGVWHDVAAPRPENPYRQETES